ncbi:hypothetical protein BY458DRAFT_498760 [Sporodiniella umbellata]|nr:hypothetical protein BY458DRAFT_498760 [Sporodiniella umbellata]
MASTDTPETKTDSKQEQTDSNVNEKSKDLSSVISALQSTLNQSKKEVNGEPKVPTVTKPDTELLAINKEAVQVDKALDSDEHSQIETDMKSENPTIDTEPNVSTEIKAAEIPKPTTAAKYAESEQVKNQDAESHKKVEAKESDVAGTSQPLEPTEVEIIDPKGTAETVESIELSKKEEDISEEGLQQVELNDSESEDKNSMDDAVSTSTSATVEDTKKHEERIAPPTVSRSVDNDITPPTPGAPPTSHNMDFSSHEEYGDVETHSANLIALDKINIKEIKANNLSPRQQEKADEPILRAVRHLFNNRFMKAKKLFENQADHDPLSALCLGSMAFLKAVMTSDDLMTKNAIEVLTTTYSIASAQIDAATKKNIGDTVLQTMSSYYNYIKTSREVGGLPSSPKPATLKSIKKDNIVFIPNGVLRAHVVKAESCLQIAILQLLQGNAMSYVKCGLNLRRAYASYSLVWQEYKRMGQVYHDFIDQDTLSGIQFGIGTVHLVLSTLPQKILRIVSAFGWKADKHLGFALLKLCLEEKRIRSPMASLMLLAYYTILTSICPQLLSDEYTQPAIETLLDAQRTYPNSAFFLYFAGRTSRLARNLTLSSQSFMYAIEISKNEWAEVEVSHICNYEIAFNHMMEHNWEEAAKIFDTLFKEKYFSPAVLRYLTGVCLDMMGQRTEAILAFADVSQLSGSKTHSANLMEKYVHRKVINFQDTGYQDMNMSLCALEYLYVFAGFDFMSEEALLKTLALNDEALNQIAEAEKIEFDIRSKELLPDTPAPRYFDQRGVLLLMRSSLYNTMGRYSEAISHLNWIIDQKEHIFVEKWVVPYAFWEAGITTWGMGDKTRSRTLWEMALKISKYDFEYSLAMRVNMAMTKAEELGVPKPQEIDPAKRYNALKKEKKTVSESSDSIQTLQDSTNTAPKPEQGTEEA